MFTLNNWTRWQLGWLLLCECTGVRKNFNLTVPDVHGSLRRKTRRRRGFLHCAPFWRTVSFSWRGPRRRTRKNNEPSLFTRRFFSCSAAGSAHAIVIPVSWEYHLGYTIIMPRTRIIAAFLIYRTTIDSVFVTLEWVLVFLLTHIRGLVLPGSTHGTHSGSV